MDSLNWLLDCFEDIKDWMASTYLKYNDSKTEVLLIPFVKIKLTEGVFEI